MIQPNIYGLRKGLNTIFLKGYLTHADRIPDTLINNAMILYNIFDKLIYKEDYPQNIIDNMIKFSRFTYQSNDCGEAIKTIHGLKLCKSKIDDGYILLDDTHKTNAYNAKEVVQTVVEIISDIYDVSANTDNKLTLRKFDKLMLQQNGEPIKFTTKYINDISPNDDIQYLINKAAMLLYMELSLLVQDNCIDPAGYDIAISTNIAKVIDTIFHTPTVYKHTTKKMLDRFVYNIEKSKGSYNNQTLRDLSDKIEYLQNQLRVAKNELRDTQYICNGIMLEENDSFNEFKDYIYNSTDIILNRADCNQTQASLSIDIRQKIAHIDVDEFKLALSTRGSSLNSLVKQCAEAYKVTSIEFKNLLTNIFVNKSAYLYVSANINLLITLRVFRPVVLMSGCRCVTNIFANNSIPHPHMAQHSCFGSYKDLIYDEFQKFNFADGLTYIESSLSNINFLDTVVIDDLKDMLIGIKDDCTPIYDVDKKELITVAEALKRFGGNKDE